MNASPVRRTTLASRLIGATIVVAALALGAGVGDLTSPDSPAHSDTPDMEPTCALMCADLTRVGGGGNVPDTFTLNGKGGGGNR